MKIVAKKVGRPTVMTEDTVAKLLEAFKLDATVKEACSYAGVDVSTYARHLKSNEDFASEVASAREWLKLKARQTVAADIGNVITAKWYLERKVPEEFREKKTDININMQGPTIFTPRKYGVIDGEAVEDDGTVGDSTETTPED